MCLANRERSTLTELNRDRGQRSGNNGRIKRLQREGREQSEDDLPSIRPPTVLLGLLLGRDGLDSLFRDDSGCRVAVSYGGNWGRGGAIRHRISSCIWLGESSRDGGGLWCCAMVGATLRLLLLFGLHADFTLLELPACVAVAYDHFGEILGALRLDRLCLGEKSLSLLWEQLSVD